METENLLENARGKLKRKNLDWIIANSLSEKDAGFASDTNTVHLINNKQQQQISGTKQNVARHVLDIIF